MSHIRYALQQTHHFWYLHEIDIHHQIGQQHLQQYITKLPVRVENSAILFNIAIAPTLPSGDSAQ